MKNIGFIVGSLRNHSYSEQLANNLIDLLPDGYEATMIPIDSLPFYNQDFDQEGQVPDTYTTFRETVKAMDGIVFVTPEYNRSIPAVLKNAVDVGSRPKSDNAWNETPAGIVSLSAGALSGFGANHHLRQSLVAVNMPVVQQPEVFIGQAGSLLDEAGKINNEDTKAFLSSFLTALTSLIDKFSYQPA